MNRPYFNADNLSPGSVPNLTNPGAGNRGGSGFTNGQPDPPREIQTGARSAFWFSQLGGVD